MGIEAGEITPPENEGGFMVTYGNYSYSPIRAAIEWSGLGDEGDLADALFFGYPLEAAGIENLLYEDTPVTVAMAQDRIDKAIAYLVSKETANG